MEIYSPQEDSELLAMNVRQLARGKVLDMGTGSGVQALAALDNKDVESVLAVDINPAAVVSLNNKLASLPQEKRSMVVVRRSDMFSDVEGEFDTIICNPPYLPDEPLVKDVALDGGSGGYEWSARFLTEAKRHIAPNGKIIFLFSNLTNKERIDSILHKLGYSFTELSKMHVGFFEVLYVYSIMAHEEKRGD